MCGINLNRKLLFRKSGVSGRIDAVLTQMTMTFRIRSPWGKKI